MSDIKVDVTLNMPRILNKVQNDNFGSFLAKDWRRLIDPFVPSDDDQTMRENVKIAPFQITYIEPYSHYMYGGEVYIDPKFKAGGFTNDGGITWFSRRLDKYPDAKKIPSGRKFNYSTSPNPRATDHWDRAAEKAGQKEKLIKSANEYLRRL